ncbi:MULTISPECIES: hypothetical protein [unclassified Bradyrhizobium]|uniref:hypothetical protein n=1 Tax=unclassified Bradyrhizobium TaxID=2631580 RepID=UPI00247AC76D|nr:MULTISPECIES: hypothetical protein [unclassified Bradyrhizobium]WGS21699.1 hypothetical protein MTX22_08350 [Bradyrhizobium sp. ISRA463]WGS28647.1 hypothetical protein MTX19_06180 [Bradyrhizobium sp. ISRA464]
MRGWAGLIVIAIAVASFSARAEISEDLKFCANLKAGKERLACYDAAARIERTKPIANVSPPAGVVKPAPIATPPRRSQFAGAYAGASGGYDIASMGTGNQSNFGLTPYAPGGAVQGPSVGAFAGYNVVQGNLLVGAELRGRYSFAKAEDSVEPSPSSTPLPVWIGSCWGCAPGGGISTDRVTLFSAPRYSASYRRPYAADASFRVGFTASDWLFYGRAGAGIEKSESIYTADDSRSVYCYKPTIIQRPNSNGGIDYLAASCASQGNGPTTTSTLVNGYAPVVSIGAGVERNFNSLFVRAEAELTGHSTPGSGFTFYYTPSVSMALGYRF